MTVEALPAAAARATQPRRLDAVRRDHGAVCGGAVHPGRAADRLARRVRLHRSRPQLHARQFHHPLHRSRLRRAALHHAHHRHLGQPDLLRRGRAHGLDRRAHGHAAAPRRSPPRHGLVRDAAVPRRHRLGAAGRAQQRPAQPALSRGDGRRPGRGAVQHLHADRPDLRHLLLHLSLRVRAGRQRARPHSRRPRGRLLDAGRQRLAHGPPRDDPAGPAGARRRRAGGLPAGDDAVRLAGDPGAARRLPHHDHQDLEPVPVSAQARACRRRRPAAADPDGGAVARAGVRAGTARLHGGRRQERRAAPRAPGMAALAGDRALHRGAVPAGVPALRRARQCRLLAHRLASC